MAFSRVLRYAVIGALVGVASTVRSILFYSLYFSGINPYGYTTAQRVWVMFQAALPLIVLCAVVGVVIGIAVARRIIKPLRVLHCALIGALLGLFPTLRLALLAWLHVPHDPARGYTWARLAWAMLERAIPEIVVSLILGAVVGILLSRQRRSTGVTGAQGIVRPDTSKQWLTDRGSFLLISGIVITAILLWYTPRLMLYPSLGVGLTWLIVRYMGWTGAGGILLLGGWMGNVLYVWFGGLYQLLELAAYLERWGELGIVIALVFASLQALGPTLIVMGLTSFTPSKRVAALEKMPSKRRLAERTWWVVAVLALALVAYVGDEAHVATAARIRVMGAVNQERDGYGYFHFQTPDLLVLWVIAPHGPEGSVSLQMRRRGAAFLQPGEYPIVLAGRSGPQDSSVFQVFVQQDSGRWVSDSGSVTIERANTRSLTGHVSMRSSRPSDSEGRAPTDTIRVQAQFTLRYDPSTVQLRQLFHRRIERHPRSSGQRPSPRAASSPPSVPPTSPPSDHILEGSFGADGRCVVHLDGRQAIPDTSRQRYTRNLSLYTPVPDGQERQILSCGNLRLSFLAPVKKVVAPGRYDVVHRKFPTVGTFTAIYSSRTPIGTGPFPANLGGRAGVLEIEAADTARIVGRFRVTAQTGPWP